MKRRNYLRRVLMIFFVMLLAVFSATAVSASADENKDTEALAEAAEQETEIVVSGEGENPETPAPEYELSRAVLSGEVLSYTGSERVKESVAVFGNITEQGETTEAELLEGTDYVLEYTDNLHAGTAVLTIRGIGHYDGKTLTETFEILQAGISGIELPSKKFEYTGAPITPEIKVFAFIADEWILLSGGSDYDVAYGGDNIHVGSVDITVTGKGDYTGSLTETFEIKGTLVSAELKYSSLKYNGTARKQSDSVTVTGNADGIVTTLKKGVDYGIAYAGNIHVGEAVMTITGKGRYMGTITKTYRIRPAEITSAKLKYAVMSYNGKARTQTGTTVVKSGNTVLKNKINYTVTYEKNTRIGTAVMTVSGKGDYTGTIIKTFAIKGRLTSAVLKYDSLKYNGTARKQSGSAIVRGNENGTIALLKRNVDYKISYANNKDAGTATVKITGKGRFMGTLTRTFRITPVSIRKVSLPYKSKLCREKALRPKPTVTANVGGKAVTLTEGTDYTVSYENNREPGTAAVIVKGVGNYQGTLKRTFQITRIKVVGSGGVRTLGYGSTGKSYDSLKAAVWSDSNGQDDQTWYTMSRRADGIWTAKVNFINFKGYGTATAHVYAGTEYLSAITFAIPKEEWLKAHSDRFKAEFLKGTNSYANIDYIQCAISIARNDYYGYDHTWRENRHTMSCAGLVGLCLTYCGYGDFIKDDPPEKIDGRRWGYLDLGTYSNKYDWTRIMLDEAHATWHAGLDGIQPGDVLYYDNNIYSNHTGFYLGNGATVESRAPRSLTSYTDEYGGEIAIFPRGLYEEKGWKGYFRIPNKNKAW